MSKNIVILCDGTGQRGGISVDEVRTNVYKLYRATKVAPDTSIDPTEQVTFYDPGIGTLPAGIGFIGAVWTKIYNLICMATGLGLTRNIVACYAAIMTLYEPGDRVFLFGFSRGAYTARCVSAVLSLCGIPTTMKDGSPLCRDFATCKKIAHHAVTKIYQHVSSPKEQAFLAQRTLMADQFRKEFGSGTSNPNAPSNVYAYFVGVFDTVASVGGLGSMVVLAILATIFVPLGALFLDLAVGRFLGFGHSYLFWLAIICGILTLASVLSYLVTHIKVTFSLPGISWLKTFHISSLRLRFADESLNTNVGWARHAISIDERRADFARVPWANIHELRHVQNNEPEWLRQVWFAGNHSDIGGGYIENESRLSDISLTWMRDEALSLPFPLHIDASVLMPSPHFDGPQHDETVKLEYRIAEKKDRNPTTDAPLHDTVYQRLAAITVLHNGQPLPYRPEPLRAHINCGQWF